MPYRRRFGIHSWVVFKFPPAKDSQRFVPLSVKEINFTIPIIATSLSALLA
ncbi:hypothetical protein [Synergistes jonesii]|uniref:hypothetical protein n=1 Tax=Synergistes jonesii TaxID=2754 RepID=UPI00242FD0BA|nr:hypothetical protein [Synergistes jonesii]